MFMRVLQAPSPHRAEARLPPPHSCFGKQSKVERESGVNSFAN